MTSSPLISASDLQRQLAAGMSPVLLDCSFDLADPALGERSHAQGHLPGALYVHLDRDLSTTKNGSNGRHPLRARADYARWMGTIGIVPGRPVVVYDRQAGMYAARAWWVLRWMGHAEVALLDGGLAAWQSAAGTVTAAGSAAVSAPAYPDLPPALDTWTAAQLHAGLDGVQVIDARAPERYRGEVEPLDAVAGHIPGALNRFFKDNLAPDGLFKPAGQLQGEFARLLDGRPVVHQCGSGVTACHNLLAMEVAGLGRSALYPGSWSEWSADPALPVARG